MKYYYQKNGESYGPISIDDIVKIIDENTLVADSSKEWKKAIDVPEILSLLIAMGSVKPTVKKNQPPPPPPSVLKTPPPPPPSSQVIPPSAANNTTVPPANKSTNDFNTLPKQYKVGSKNNSKKGIAILLRLVILGVITASIFYGAVLYNEKKEADERKYNREHGITVIGQNNNEEDSNTSTSQSSKKSDDDLENQGNAMGGGGDNFIKNMDNNQQKEQERYNQEHHNSNNGSVQDNNSSHQNIDKDEIDYFVKDGDIMMSKGNTTYTFLRDNSIIDFVQGNLNGKNIIIYWKSNREANICYLLGNGEWSSQERFDCQCNESDNQGISKIKFIDEHTLIISCVNGNRYKKIIGRDGGGEESNY